MPTLADAFDFLRSRPAPPLRPSPAAPEFRDLLAALLGRTLAPAAVRTTLDALDELGLTDAAELADADLAELSGMRDAPAPRTLKPLLTLARWVAARGGMDALEDAPTEALRDDLRGLRGIGPAGVDAVLLDGLDRPVFPVDRSSYRILVRHGWLEPEAGYDEASDALRRYAPDEPAALRALAARLDEIGARFCKASAPRCEKCPLRPLLPEGGPLAPGLE
jgi:endonuclease-3 related protein